MSYTYNAQPCYMLLEALHAKARFVLNFIVPGVFIVDDIWF